MASWTRLRLLATGVILIARTSSGQAAHTTLPCTYDGQLLRDSRGEIVQYTSSEMKQRATAKQDLNGSVKQFDFRSVMLLKVLVGESGDVVCVKTISGGPISQKETEEALRHWKFRVAKMAGKPVSYIGWLEFTLCNISCGSEGYSMTLLK